MSVLIYERVGQKQIMNFNVFITTIDQNNISVFEDIFINRIKKNKNIIAENKKFKNSHMWYFKKSIKNQELWNKLNKNDWCLFGFNSKYILAGKIEKKINDSEIENMIKIVSNVKQPINVLRFSNIIKTDLNMLQTNRKFGFADGLSKMHKISFVKVKEFYIKNILKDFESFQFFLNQKSKIKSSKKIKSNKKNNKTSLNSIMDDENPPLSIQSKIIRKIRNSKKAEMLKKKYDNNCQICGVELNISQTKKYSEVHHVWPLGKNGKDNADNMLVLCPNHHTQFDFAYIGFDKNDSKKIINLDGEVIGQIDYIKNHSLNKTNIMFHIKKMEEK